MPQVRTHSRERAASSEIDVSVIVPVRNDVDHIERCLDSILSQQTGKLVIEVLAVDGLSTDGTNDVLLRRAAADSRLRVLENPARRVSPALNIGIRASRGRVLIRMDAHALYESDYIYQCWTLLQTTGASAVGGTQVPVPARDTSVARANAAMQESWFGLGGGAHRRAGFEGPVHTLWLGAFSRELAVEIGGFDEALFRSEDNDFFQRVRANGGSLYLSPRIRASYVCRATLGALAKQYFVTGCEILPTLVRNPHAFAWRHLAPVLAAMALLFLSGLAVTNGPLATLAGYMLAMAVLAYVGTLILVSSAAARRSGARLFLPLLLAFPIVHLAYGAGTLSGLVRVPFARRRSPLPGSTSRVS